MKKTLLALSLAFGYAGMQATSMIDPALAPCLMEGKSMEQCKAEVYGRQKLGIPTTSSPSIGVSMPSIGFSPTGDPIFRDPRARTTGGPLTYYK